jgi:di/tricarboxylate transporter
MNDRYKESGKVNVKVFWKTGLIISIVLSVLGTIILNLILN